MMLEDTGRRVRTETGENAQAKDGNGYVTIEASSEAVQDHGWIKIFDAANKKFSDGDYNNSEGLRKIKIVLSDF